jgi:hypothetical protein
LVLNKIKDLYDDLGIVSNSVDDKTEFAKNGETEGCYALALCVGIVT